ncbi:MAG: hypothetical protein ACPIOQ_61825 [Promethearchaeia archaeon]
MSSGAQGGSRAGSRGREGGHAVTPAYTAAARTSSSVKPSTWIPSVRLDPPHPPAAGMPGILAALSGPLVVGYETIQSPALCASAKLLPAFGTCSTVASFLPFNFRGECG